MYDDISSESDINVDNPELELLELESKVGHEIGASMSTINENNNEKNEQHCSSEKSCRKGKKSVVMQKKKTRKNINLMYLTNTILSFSP